MKFSQDAIDAANEARAGIQGATKTIREGEAAAITAWYTFICDHADAMGYDPKELAREQLEAFLEHAEMVVVRAH